MGELLSRAAGEEAESVVEPREERTGFEHPDTGCGELDGQRQTVETTADAHDRFQGGGRELEIRTDLTGSIREQKDRLGLTEIFGRTGPGEVVARERGDDKPALPRKTQRLPTGDEDPHARTSLEHGMHEKRRRLQQVFAVVENEKRVR
jgi:hypothetical protein